MQARPHVSTEVMVKLLQNGGEYPAQFCSLEGSLLQLEIAPETGTQGNVFQIGALLEIQTQAALYLGELEFRRGTLLGIRCEHSVDLRVLSEIRSRWSLPAEVPAHETRNVATG
jgi:hypothetical protein